MKKVIVKCKLKNHDDFEKKLTEKKLLKKVKKVVDKHDLIKYSIQVARQKAEHKHEDLPCRLRKNISNLI